MLLEVGLVLLTIHLVSGSTWLHHLVDLPVPMLALFGACIPGKVCHAGVRGWTVVPALGVFVPALLLLQRPQEWSALAARLSPGNTLLIYLASNMGVWILLGLWALVAAALLYPARREVAAG